MLDSGSEGSLIKQSVIEKYDNYENKIIRIPKINLIGINGKKLGETNKTIISTVNFNNISINMQLLIVSNMDYDILMGSDELNKNGGIIDYENKQFLIKGTSINFKEVEKTGEEENNQMDKIEAKNETELKYEQEGQHKKIRSIKEGAAEKNNNEELYMKNDDELNENNYIMNLNIDGDVMRRREVGRIIKKYEGLIKEESRVASDYVHEIKVKNIESFKPRSYPIPQKYKEDMQRTINKLLEDKIIEYSTTQYINPVVIVKKKDGDIRICLDARNLNKCMIPEYEAPLTIEAILGKIDNANFFTKLDLKHSFWLIPLHKNSRDYTGFIVDGVVYRFCVTPFGIQTATSALLKALHKILNRYEKFTLHYIDDILIFSKNEKEHLEHVEIILKALDEAGLKLNFKKCQFFKKEVIYLGFKIDRTGITMDPDRVKLIEEYKRPTNLKTLRGFLGTLNYFKRMIPNLSEMEIPLISLLKKNVRWKWDKEKEDAFNKIKSEFAKQVRLYHPDYTKEFILKTDASMHRFAGVLIQKQEEKEVPIAFVSRLTKKAEKNYAVSELELASIIFCVTKLRFFLLGGKFTIETDNQALISIIDNKYKNARIHRWALLLQEYTFEVKFTPGKKNIADAITRMDGKVTEIDRNKVKIGYNILKDSKGIYSMDEIINNQRNLTDKEKKRCKMKNNVYIKLDNGNNELFVITKDLAERIITDLHERYNHLGVRKTMLTFRENYISKNDIITTKDIIRKCKICQLAKEKNKLNENVPKTIIANRPLEIIAVDFISNLIPSNEGSRHIFVVTDVFTKFVNIYPCKKTNKKVVKECLTNYFIENGIPSNCIMDNATYFNNENMKTWLRKTDIKPVYTSIRHPCSNPAERAIKEVIKQLRILIHSEQNLWEQNLNRIQEYMNRTPNTITEVAPLTLMKGEYPERPWDCENQANYDELINKVKIKLEKHAKNYIRKKESKQKRKVTFKYGDLVILKALRVPDKRNDICAKFLLPFEGPYKILTRNGVNSYELGHLDSGKSRGIFNIQQLYKFHQA